MNGCPSAEEQYRAEPLSRNHAALPLQRVTGLVLRLDAQVVLMPLKPLYMPLKQLRELPPMAYDTSLVRQASLNEAAPLF